MNIIMTTLSGTNDIVDLVANYYQATDDSFIKLSNVLTNFFTSEQSSGNQNQNLQNQTLGSVEVLWPQ